MAITTYTPTTKLEAVNLMLSAIGEAPISSLDISGLLDAATAQNILHEVMRSVQMKRWSFNTEKEYVLTRNGSNEIPTPANALFIEVSDVEATGADIVWRGSKLYDRKNHTYTFTKSLKCDITFFLPFEELPETARHFISIRAARIFVDRMLGSDALHAYTLADEQMAWVAFNDAEGEVEDFSIFDNISVSGVLIRAPGSTF